MKGRFQPSGVVHSQDLYDGSRCTADRQSENLILKFERLLWLVRPNPRTFGPHFAY